MPDKLQARPQQPIGKQNTATKFFIYTLTNNIQSGYSSTLRIPDPTRTIIYSVINLEVSSLGEATLEM